MPSLKEILEARKAGGTPSVQPALIMRTPPGMPASTPASQPASAMPPAPVPARVNPLAAALRVPASSSAAPVDLETVASMELTITNDMRTWPDQAASESAVGDPVSDEFVRRLALVESTLMTGDVGDALINTLTFLHDHPQLKEILLPEQIGTLVRALQSSHGIVLAQKTQRSSKKAASTEKVNAIANELADIFGGDTFL